jgi:isopentenyldiphosphate isomerase
VLQQRSHAKVDWPGAPDRAVAGHISQAKDDSELSYLDGAWKEIEEEIGLPRSEAGRFLVEGGLTPVGAPYCSFDSDVRRNPPFYNSEIGRIFAATITGEALGRLRFTDHEVEGVMLVTAERAWEMLSHGNIAGGMRYALPRYLDWLEQRQQLAQCHQNETENHR